LTPPGLRLKGGFQGFHRGRWHSGKLERRPWPNRRRSRSV
jgi:hypothetical protein